MSRSLIIGLILLATTQMEKQANSNLYGQESNTRAQVLPDQFSQLHDLSEWRGRILVILYGDRNGMPPNKSLGELLHNHYHPTAKGKSPGAAAGEPVIPVPGVAPEIACPDVRVLPIACLGSQTEIFKKIVRKRVKNEAESSIVLLDFEDKMKGWFGLKAGQPNLLILDHNGRVKYQMAGPVDKDTFRNLLATIDKLRVEALKK